MSIFYEYPYTDSSRANADWLLQSVNRLVKMVDDGDLDKLFDAEAVIEDLKAVQQSVAALNTEIKPKNLKEIKCVAIGDSYARGNGGIIGQGTFYYIKDYFKSFTGYANGGAGYVQPGNVGSGDFGGQNFQQKLESLRTEISASARSEVGALLTLGGYNDAAFSVSGFADAIRTYVIKARELFPNAKIYCISPFIGRPFDSAKWWNYYSTLWRVTAENGAIPCPPAIWWFLNRSDYWATDLIHLNDSGYRALGPMVASYMQGWNGYISTNLGAGDVTNPDNVSGVTVSYRSGIDGITAWIRGTFRYTGYNNDSNPFFVTLGEDKRPNTTSYIPVMAYNNSDNSQSIMGALEISHNGGVHLVPWFAKKLSGDYTIYINAVYIRGI